VLAAPSDEGVFYLDTDASDQALGAVLQQEQDGAIRVIGYASRAISDAERNYCTTREELLAVIFGLKQYSQFLLVRECFVIRTDHAALTQLKRTPEPLGQQARWLDLLAEYNFRIQHRAGTAHRNCDALSRRPCERETEDKCKQCRPKPRASCFAVHGNEDLIFWNSAVKPLDSLDVAKLEEAIEIRFSGQLVKSQKVSGSSGNIAVVSDQSGTCSPAHPNLSEDDAGREESRSSMAACMGDCASPNAGVSRFTTATAGDVISVSGLHRNQGTAVQPIVHGSDPSLVTESVADRETRGTDETALGAEGMLCEVGADHRGRSEAYWSNFPIVTGNVADSEQICQNQTEGREIGESRCEAVDAARRAGDSLLVAEGRHRDAVNGDNLRSCSLVGEVASSSTPSVAYWSNLSTVTESVAGNRQEWQKEAEQ